MHQSATSPDFSLSDIARGRDRAGEVARNIIREAESLSSFQATMFALFRTTFDIEIMYGSVRTWALRINVKRRRQFARLKELRGC